MATEADRKKVDQMSYWDQLKSSFQGGYDNEAQQKKKAQANDAQAEALRRQMLKTQSTAGY